MWACPRWRRLQLTGSFAEWLAAHAGCCCQEFLTPRPCPHRTEQLACTMSRRQFHSEIDQNDVV